MTEVTYMVRRFYQDDAAPDHGKLIKVGLTLAEARAHCSDPQTQGEDKYGKWFDGFDAEA